MPDPNPTLRPPDMVGAGAYGQPQDPASLIGLLRSQGSLPAEALMPMMGPQPSASPLASALLGGVAMMPGQTGAQQVVHGNQQAAQFQQQQQMQMAQIMERVQDRKQQQAWQQNQAAIKIAQTMTEHSDPEIKAHGWREIGRLSAPLGLNFPPEILARLGRGELSGTDLSKIIGMLDDGVPPQEIAHLTGLDPRLIAQAAPIAQSDSTRRMLKLPTRAEAQDGKVKSQQEALKLAQELWGLFPKDPRTPYALKYTLDTFGLPFSEASQEQQKEAVEKSGAIALKIGAPTALVKNALAEFNPTADPNDPVSVKNAVNAYRAKRQQEGLARAATQGQLSVIGRTFSTELNRINIAQDKLRTIDILVDDMNRLIQEGRSLHLTDNPQAINAIQQELVHWTGGPMSKGAAWYRAFATLDARFASVAQGIEQITGNRLAVTNVQRALAFHPKQTDPYTVQLRVARELQNAVANVRQAVGDDTARVLRQYQSAAGAAGVPFVLGVENKVESVEEEK